MSGKLDLNRATAGDLEKVSGVTRALARRIVAARDAAGGFASLAEVREISGINAELFAALEEHVEVDATAADEKTHLIRVDLDPQRKHAGAYGGYKVTAELLVLTPVAGTDATLPVPRAVTSDTSPDGLASVKLPAPASIQGPVAFVVRAPDGEVLARVEKPKSELRESLPIPVVPRSQPTTQPTDDPAFNRPTKLRGRVIDRAGRVQIADKQVVVWTATVAEPSDADFAPVLASRTDANGYFSGPYPLGSFTVAHATVALDPTQAVTIRLGQDGALPADVILVVDAPRSSAEPKDGDCDCASETTPRNPDAGDLVNGAFSSDIGQGRCVDFTRPDRTLQEFSYRYVVRTTEPSIKGLTLGEPPRVPPKLLDDIIKLSELTLATSARLARSRDDTAGAATATAATAMAADKALPLDDLELHADLWRKTVNRPDKATVDALLDVAKTSKFLDINRAIDQSLAAAPGRARLDCKNAVDWDDPTIYQACTVAHGHILHFKQEWIADGYSMGRLLYSLPLAPGQKKQIAVLDWERRESAIRQESLEETESLQATLARDRDIGEMVHSVLSESTRGGSTARTSAFGGGFGAILPGGGLLGIGGGASKASSTAWQDSSRSVAADSLQTLRDRTSQAAASMRAQRSTVVQTVTQGERVSVTTESVANYNHCHAMTVEYFEVLRHLIVRQRLVDVQECLFVPLQMARFDRAKALRWRNTLKSVVTDRSLRAGFDALERIEASYEGSDLPTGAYADERLDYLEGELTIRFQLARPRDDDEDNFNPASWAWMGLLLPMLSPLELYKNFLQGQARKDRIFLEQVGPRIARAFVDLMRIAWVDTNDVEHPLPVDLTLLSNFSNDAELAVSIRMAGAVPPVARKDIKFIKVSELAFPGVPFANVLPANSRVIVERGQMSYRTKFSSGYLFRSGRIANDLTGSDAVRVYTPLSQQELRNPRQEDKELARRLLDFLNENLEVAHHAIWQGFSGPRLYMLLDGFEAPNSGGRSLASVVDDRLIGIAGNSLILAVSRGFHLDPTFNQDVERPIDLFEHYQPNTPIEPVRVAIPTRGVYAEAVMGACNSCETKEEQRFWRWEESPLPDSPPAILPVSTDTRQSATPDLTAKDFPAPIVAMQAVPAAPDPTGLAGALNLLGQAGVFKDITGLEGNQKNAAAALQSAMDTAQFFGGKAADLALQGKMSKDIDKTTRAIEEAKAKGLITDAQAQELTKGALNALIGGGAGGEDKELTSVPEVKQAIQRASGPGGEVNLSRAFGGDREDLALKMPTDESGRSWIMEPADQRAWARARSFNPSPTNPSKTGKTVLKVTTRPLPEGGSVRWSVPPDQTGRYTLAGGKKVQSGLKADVTGIRPGLAKIDFDVFDADGNSVESQKYDLSIPQFVTVDENSAFAQVVERFGLTAFKDDILIEAKGTCDNLLSDANVRLIWTMAPFSETLPAHLTSDLVTKVDLAGDPSGTFSGMLALLGVTLDRDGNSVHVGPTDFDEVIQIFPGAMTDPMITDLDDGVVATIQASIDAPPLTSNPAGALAVTVVGRVIGTSMAHEILHALVGAMFPLGAAHTNAQRDILRNGSGFTFEHLTGVQITDAANFPDAGSFTDIGRDHINRPQVDGTLPGITANFPVPPAFP
jgi:hypothetical protein